MVTQAQANLAPSQQTLAAGIYYAASWFAQQSVEKAAWIDPHFNPIST